ncbi:MAG: PqqD family protein [Acidimicrobiales bacterium]|nr:PqqD family protein [Acidimicrobiales bacterium]
MSDSVRLVKAGRTFYRKTSDATVALCTSNEPMVLRGSARIVYDAFESPTRPDDVIDLVAAAFDMSSGEARAAVEPIVEELVAAGLIGPPSSTTAEITS